MYDSYGLNGLIVTKTGKKQKRFENSNVLNYGDWRTGVWLGAVPLESRLRSLPNGGQELKPQMYSGNRFACRRRGDTESRQDQHLILRNHFGASNFCAQPQQPHSC